MIIMMIILRITMMIKMTKCIVLWKDKCNSSTGNDQIMTLLLSVHDVSWVVGLVVWLSWLQGWMGWLIDLVDADFCMTFHFLSRELLNSLLSSADWIFHWKPRDLNFSSKQELLNFSLNSLQNREVISRRSLEEKNLGKKKKSKKAANVKNAVFVKLRRTKKMKSKKTVEEEKWWKSRWIVRARCPHPALHQIIKRWKPGKDILSSPLILDMILSSQIRKSDMRIINNLIFCPKKSMNCFLGKTNQQIYLWMVVTNDLRHC